jgi:AraC-like DNA-binding protein
VCVAQRRGERLIPEQLLDRADVEGVALAVGYDSTSAFIACFRVVLGTTPGR